MNLQLDRGRENLGDSLRVIFGKLQFMQEPDLEKTNWLPHLFRKKELSESMISKLCIPRSAAEADGWDPKTVGKGEGMRD